MCPEMEWLRLEDICGISFIEFHMLERLVGLVVFGAVHGSGYDVGSNLRTGLFSL
jgi:hypothetical protein